MRDTGGLDYQGSQPTLATVWQIKRATANVIFAFTEHDRNLSRDLGNGNGTQNHISAPGFARSAVQAALGFEVPNMNANGYLSAIGITSADIRAGLFRGAECWVARIDWKGAPGIIRMHRGYLSDAMTQDWSFEAQIDGLTTRLTETEIVEHYSRECQADFKDSRCGYTGPNTSCDKQYSTCLAYKNILNFRGHGYLMPGTTVSHRHAVRPRNGQL